MAKMYEVLRFVEHGTDCRQSIDCLQGELLIYYLRDNTQLEKQVLFEWFRQIAGEVGKYQRSRHGQNYRCLTPYSIVVTEEGELLLLNPDADENEFAMKKMQQKAVRRHFIRPAAQGSNGKNYPADLYGYGKILQFLLAYTDQIPELTKTEERKLERIIERCTEGVRRPYDKISQVIRDLPEEKTELNLNQKEKLRKIKLAILLFTAGAVIAAAGIGLNREKSTELSDTKSVDVQGEKKEDRKEESVTKESKEKNMSVNSGQPEDVEQQIRSQMESIGTDDRSVDFGKYMASYVIACLESWKDQTEEEKDEELIFLGERMEKDLLLILADVYEREEQLEKAIQTYDRLLKFETRREQIQEIEQKKAGLEERLNKQEQAVSVE